MASGEGRFIRNESVRAREHIYQYSVSHTEDLDDNLLRNRDFGLYFSGVFMATLANQIQSVAVAWQIYELARTPLALGYVGLAQFLPIAALFFFAGDIADRQNRRRILAISYAVQAVATALLLLLTLLSAKSQLPFYAVLVLLGSARAFGQPAGQSFLPQLVSGRRFLKAVAWTSSARQIAVIFGPALGGVIYIWGPAAAYAVCLFLFVVTSLAVGALRTDSQTHQHDPAVDSFQRVTAGIRFIRSKPILLGAISLDLFAVLLGGATALLPIYARDILQVGPRGLGLLGSAPAIGAALTGMLLGRVPLSRSAGLAMFASIAIFGVATMVFGLSTDFTESVVTLAVLGASDMVSVYIRSTLVQLATPDAMRGRVSAVNSLFIGASNQLGEFESGLTAAWFGTVPSVVVGGAGSILVVVLWMTFFPSLRKLNRLSDLGIENEAGAGREG
jgi:predicted MFS family arabinose efflux permease